MTRRKATCVRNDEAVIGNRRSSLSLITAYCDKREEHERSLWMREMTSIVYDMYKYIEGKDCVFICGLPSSIMIVSLLFACFLHFVTAFDYQSHGVPLAGACRADSCPVSHVATKFFQNSNRCSIDVGTQSRLVSGSTT